MKSTTSALIIAALFSTGYAESSHNVTQSHLTLSGRRLVIQLRPRIWSAKVTHLSNLIAKTTLLKLKTRLSTRQILTSTVLTSLTMLLLPNSSNNSKWSCKQSSKSLSTKKNSLWRVSNPRNTRVLASGLATSFHGTGMKTSRTGPSTASCLTATLTQTASLMLIMTLLIKALCKNLIAWRI